LTPNELLSLPPAEAEEACFTRLRILDETWKFSYPEIGLLCRQVEAKHLWKQRIDSETGKKCSSFARWVRVAAPWSYATVFAAMRDVEELQDVPAEHLAEIPAANIGTLKQLSTAVRQDPAIIEAAKTMRAPEFVEQVRKEYPLQHLEKKKTLRFSMDESAADKVEQVLQMAEAKGARNWSEALEMIAEEAADVWRLEAEVEQVIAEGEVRGEGK